ncbi:MAG: hypothetical protein KJ626_03780 [Verrucomicrobia bacterium]|nr:hypothetical protein [Verrucomicrobiota bacterium]
MKASLQTHGGCAELWCAVFAVIALAALSIPEASAAILAFDDSDDAAYDDSFPQWDTGDNGGYGFTAWTLSPAPNIPNAGFFTATAAQNGTGGSSGGAINAGDGDSWGLYANSAETAAAYRGFDYNGDSTLDSLGLNYTFTIKMDNGWNDDTVGFILRNGNNTSSKNSGQRLEFRHASGGNYLVNDNSGDVDTGVAWTADGLTLTVTLTGANSYSMGIPLLFSLRRSRHQRI